MAELLVGIELECVYNKELLDINKGGWRDSSTMDKFFNGWAVTHDGSLNTNRTNFVKSGTVEIVSKAFPKNELSQYIKNIKDKCLECKPKSELKDFFEFNASCGAHIHFSTTHNKENNMLSMEYYKRLRERVFKRVKREVPSVYSAFRRQYYRSYAQRQTGDLIDKSLRGEISYTSPSKGIEWRSFNLKNVTTWEELERMLKIGVEELNKIMDEYEEAGFKEEFGFQITDDLIQSYLDTIKVLIREV